MRIESKRNHFSWRGRVKHHSGTTKCTCELVYDKMHSGTTKSESWVVDHLGQRHAFRGDPLGEVPREDL